MSPGERPRAGIGEAGRVFLTGATGFIGSRVARRFAERGWELVCLVRSSSDTRTLEGLGADLVEGDVDSVSSIEQGLTGADLAYHLAAIYQVGVVDADRLERVNVGGTCNFLEALRRAGTPRAVYVSTTVALGPVAEGEGDETSTHPGDFRTAYERTKTEAHSAARLAQQEGLPVMIACPAFVYGPGDRGPAGDFLRDLLHGRLPGLPARTAWLSFVHVDDVADGLVLVGLRGSPGATYVLSGENAQLEEFAVRAAAEAGRRAPRLRFPVPLVRLTGSVLDAVSRATGVRFPITREGVEATGGDVRWLHSHEATTRELGWRPRPLAEGLPETVRSALGT